MRLLPLTSSLLAAALLAPSAHAQEAICGGISTVGDWAGGEESASDVATADAPLSGEGQVPIAGHLVRMFTLSAPAQVRVEVAARPAGDPYIAVFDAEGAEVAGDDDSGGDFAARAEVDLEAGTYCLAARSYESGVTDIAFRIGRTEQEALTEGSPATGGGDRTDAPVATGPGCFEEGVPTLGTAALGTADLSETLTHSAPVGEAPAVGFELAEPAAITVTATSADGDPLITLIDEGGSELAQNDDHDGLNSRIDMTTPMAAGRYCVEVDDLNGAFNPIEIALTAFDPEAERRERIARGTLMPVESDGIEIRELGDLTNRIRAEIGASDSATWSSFDIPEAGLLVAETISNDADPVLTLFDRDGREIAYNDDGPVGRDARIVARLFPGRYVIATTMIEGGQAKPIRLVLERWVPAQ